MAKYCVLRGVDYLGVHVINFCIDEQKKKLCRYISSLDGKSVIVTKETRVDRLKKIVNYYQPYAIQLHSRLSSEEIRKICRATNCKVVPVVTDSILKPEVQEILRISDYCIYDTSYIGGTAKKILSN